MMRRFLILTSAMLYAISLLADEGMWLPSLIGEQKLDDMRKRGYRLTAEDLYSINQASLKDAIVMFGRGCTGGIVSAEGLMLTNHHCGFGSIQKHSSLEHDYLTDGFWAMSRDEELPNPGLTVTLLVRMEDVTERVGEVLTGEMTEEERALALSGLFKTIVEEATKDSPYSAEVKPLFGGNQFFLYVTLVYKDVRLVGAPPSAIGNFGGDTDNWMWPRHTGDFSVFRIYADSSNMPADYSPSNVPYKPARFLEISISGVEKGDFTMVYGFPASTRQYLTSGMVELIANVSNPARTAIRREKLDIMGADMAADPKVRIQYASKYAGVANAWKKWLGESRGLNRFGAVEKKRLFEEEFTTWAQANGGEYASILPAFDQLVTDMTPLQNWIDQFSESVWSLDIIRYAAGFRGLAELEDPSKGDLQKETDRLSKGAAGFFKDYNQPTDRKLLAAMLRHFRGHVGPGGLPSIYEEIDNKFKGNVDDYVNWVYDESFMVTEAGVRDFLGNYKTGKKKALLNDPVYALMMSFYGKYQADYAAGYKELLIRQDSLQRMYIKAIMDMKEGQVMLADANSTLRISFGVVNDYFPRDAVYYDYQTTLGGIMEKDNPDIYDYRVPLRLKELYEAKDYGRYGSDGELNVCFTAANHTTGGNSGSPVLDAYGRLIGLNFDRNWEGTMSDIMYDPDMCRNIILDIRYCLFIMDKYAGAKHLVEEMRLVE